jgi:hypothetical protein
VARIAVSATSEAKEQRVPECRVQMVQNERPCDSLLQNQILRQLRGVRPLNKALQEPCPPLHDLRTSWLCNLHGNTA